MWYRRSIVSLTARSLPGIGVALKASDPNVRVIGVEPEGADAFGRSLRAGHPVELDHPQRGKWFNVGMPIKLSDSPAVIKRSPTLGEHTDEILAELAKITGLKAPKKVDSDTITKDGVKKFLESRIEDVVKPEELRAEETALKKLGLVPRDFDLRKTTVELLTEQWYPLGNDLLPHLNLIEALMARGLVEIKKKGSRWLWATKIYCAGNQ